MWCRFEIRDSGRHPKAVDRRDCHNSLERLFEKQDKCLIAGGQENGGIGDDIIGNVSVKY